MIAFAVLTALAISGCGGTTPGTATGTPPEPTAPGTAAGTPDTSTSADPLADVNPCALVDPAAISRNHLQQDKSGTEAGARYCRWRNNVGATTSGYIVGVNIYDRAGLDQLPTAGFAVSNYPIGRHQGRMSKDTVGGTCSVSIGVSSTSRVDVVGIDSGGRLDRACVVATSLAPIVEERLPGGGG